jgi:poly-gamma-glutamate synthesis protein (capsule biosynthesis protein)
MGNLSPGSSIRFAFVGDICLAGGMQHALAQQGPDHPFINVRTIFPSADIVVGNLECCIIDREREPDTPDNVMRVPAPLASGLCRSGIDVVTLANNHTLDDGASGLQSTQQFLDGIGIRHFGAGRDLRDAESPLFVNCRGHRVALLGACDVPRVFASESEAGVAPIDLERLIRRIDECKDRADVVVVCLHADLEFTKYPSPGRVRLSRNLVDHGADLVVQHHPHVCQGLEKYGDGLIAYSIGNFIFHVHGNRYLQGKSGTDWGIVLQAEVDVATSGNKVSYKLAPVTINARNETVLSEGAALDEQISVINQSSSELGSWRLLRRQRVRRCVHELKINVLGLYYLWRRKGLVATLKSISGLLKDPYERRWMLSLLTLGAFE